MNISLENVVGAEQVASLKSKTWYEPMADVIGTISHSLTIGTFLDAMSGLTIEGCIAARAYATVMNSITGGPYGWYQDKWYAALDASPESSGTRKFAANMGAFNTFQTAFYGTAVAVGDYLSTGSVNTEKVMYGMGYLAVISPLVSPSLTFCMNKSREFFGLETASEKAGE